MAYDRDLAERVRRYLAGRVDAVEKRMVGGWSFSVGGRMCCGVRGAALMVRLGRDGAAAALQEPHVRPMEFGGRPIEAFVLVEPQGFADDASLAAWVDRGLAFLEEDE
jgi:hypothetical protein